MQSPTSKITGGALIMKGGGVKGLAFAGALTELQKYFDFQIFVGTSAGAIAAVLLASGYDANELELLLRQTDFASFLDGYRLAAPWNVAVYGGIHPGDTIRNWVRRLLNAKIPRADRIPLHALPRRAIIYASASPFGTLTFDSQGDNEDQDADFAVRCSMSIPWLFFNQYHSGYRVVDGGLLANFPVDEFLKAHPSHRFLALYLGSSTMPPYRRRSQWADIVDIFLGRDERAVVTRHKDSTIVIDPSPIRTIDFALSEAEKDFLVLEGRRAALQYLASSGLPSAPSTATVESITERAARARRLATRARKVARLRFFVRRAPLTAVLLTLLLYYSGSMPIFVEQPFGQLVDDITSLFHHLVAGPIRVGNAVVFDGNKKYEDSGFEFSSGERMAWNDPRCDIMVAENVDRGTGINFFLPNDRPPYDDKNNARAGIAGLQANELSEVSEVPADGYRIHYFKPQPNGVYAVRTRSGRKYAVIKVVVMADDRIEFAFAFQPNGSRRFGK